VYIIVVNIRLSLKKKTYEEFGYIFYFRNILMLLISGFILLCNIFEHFYDFSIEQNDDFDECQYCLCKPCITHENNRQMWWETENQIPHERNSMLRKSDYKRFWTKLNFLVSS
jgi:hypothetical protein